MIFSPLVLAVESTVVVYAATDREIAAPLIADFQTRYPGITVEYHDMNSTDLYNRVVAQSRDGEKVDVIWSSAMDLQLKLVNDGYAQVHRSAETAALPAWAIWNNEAFGTTYEPIGFVYNRKLLDKADVPQTHAELARILTQRPNLFRDRLTTYDPNRSGLGYLLHSQDLEANPVVFWSVVRAMVGAGLKTEASTSAMLDRIASGKALLGYNVLASYALARASKEPTLGVVLPRDYTLVMTRVAFISRHAPHPEAARLWMDYLLSRAGQNALNRVGLFAVRTDLEVNSPAAELRKQLGNAFRPIVLGTGLLTYLDQMKRSVFLGRWGEAINLRTDTAQLPIVKPGK